MKKKGIRCHLFDKAHKKLWLSMKLCIIFVVFLQLTSFATGNAQEQMVSLNLRDVSYYQLFNEIHKQTGLRFIYNTNQLEGMPSIEVRVEKKKVSDVLRDVLAKTPFTFQFDDDVVMLVQRSQEPQKKMVRVKGFVYDKQKEPMPGVTVKVVGVSVGTATNAKGWFALDLPLLKGSLEFSFIGFKKQQVNFTEKTDTLRIIMEEDISDLDEVTVIAYGERNRREVVSSISSVKGDEIKEIPTSSFTNLLQGRMAGVEITNQSGSPGGGGTRVAVRGYNSLMVSGASDGQPLYVIDGIPMHSFTSPVTGTNALAELDPSTIESVEVLKDAAAAAIYGSRAGNGVILITTKKGKVGRANFSANVSYSASIMPKFPFQLAGREERWWRIQQRRNYRESKYDYSTKTGYYPTSYEDAYYNGGQYDKFWNAGSKTAVDYMLQDSLNPFYNNQTNWWKKLFRTGEVMNANLQASGGNEKIRYMVGMGYYTEEGIMVNSSFKRANFITNLNMKPTKRIRLDTRLYLAYTDKSRNTGGAGNASAIEAMTADPKITMTLLPGGGEVEKEILEYLNGTVDRSDSYRMMLNANLGVDIIQGLNFTTSLGLDYSQNNANVFTPSYLDYKSENLSRGQVNRNIGITQENLLRYTRNVHDIHRFEILAGLTFTKNQTFNIQGSAKRGASDKVYYVDGNHSSTHDYGTKENPNVQALKDYTSSFTEQVMVSYLGRLAYNYKQKYLLEFTFRRDGSSAFGEDVRYANFPAVAVGWSFGEETFIKDQIPWLNMGKIRASWGTSGQTLNDPYLAHGVIELARIPFMGNQGMEAPMINRNLSWEKSDQYDFGLDMDLFDYRLKFKLDYYYKYTKSLLYEVTLPGNVLGSRKQWQNVMEVSNEGIELELMGDIIRKSGLSWRTRFNVSRNWNRFEKSYTGMDINRLVIGRPIYGIYLYDDTGIIQNSDEVPRYSRPDGSIYYLGKGLGKHFLPGMRMIRDANGDGKISDSDKVYTSGTVPLASGGWAHEIIWKNFDLNLLFVYTINRHIINMFSRHSLYSDGDYPVFYDYSGLSFWEKEGDDTDFISLGFSDETMLRSQLENVNYLRLKSLTLGYNVPVKVLKNIGLSGARIFFTGENLFMWTNYSGLDPETVDITSGQDNMGSYPLARKFTFGLTINF